MKFWTYIIIRYWSILNCKMILNVCARVMWANERIATQVNATRNVNQSYDWSVSNTRLWSAWYYMFCKKGLWVKLHNSGGAVWPRDAWPHRLAMEGFTNFIGRWPNGPIFLLFYLLLLLFFILNQVDDKEMGSGIDTLTIDVHTSIWEKPC